MAHVYRRRFCQRVSSTLLQEGRVDQVLVQRTGHGTDTVEISVYDIDEKGEQDRITRYVISLDKAELEKLVIGLQRNLASMD